MGRAMNTRENAGLLGPVKVCRTDVTTLIRGCGKDGCDTEPKEQTRWAISRYSVDGRIVEFRQHSYDGREWTSAYTYDQTGLLREVETRDRTGWLSKGVYDYDPMGRLLRVVVREADGSERTAQAFSYDDQHRTKTQYFHSTPDGKDLVVSFGIEGTDTSFSTRGATSMTTLYDDQDRPVETVFRDSEHRPIIRVTLRYDNGGRLVEESQTTMKEQILPPEMMAQLNPGQLQTVKAIFGVGSVGRKNVHRYDSQGRRVETITSMGPSGFERKTMDYNDEGDLTEQILFRTFKTRHIDDQGRIVDSGESSIDEMPSSEARFSYQYDEHGNWIERIVSNRSQPDKPFAVCSVERRSLTYFTA